MGQFVKHLFGTMLLKVACLALIVGVAFATTGVDVSMADCPNYDTSTYQCMKDNYGNSFAIIEGFDGGYQINEHIKSCTDAAWNAGFAHVDVYGFFCPNCGGNNPCSDAVNNLLDYMSENGVKFGTLWIDVEQCNGCWSSDLSSNFDFVKSCADAASSRGQAVGIYSSHYEWGQTCGSATGLQNLPLWYADYDGAQNFDDFEAFGGWTTPAMKQYNDHGDSDCNASVDVDWYPS